MLELACNHKPANRWSRPGCRDLISVRSRWTSAFPLMCRQICPRLSRTPGLDSKLSWNECGKNTLRVLGSCVSLIP